MKAIGVKYPEVKSVTILLSVYYNTTGNDLSYQSLEALLSSQIILNGLVVLEF